MKTYTPDQLAAILAAHREWLANPSKGNRADLSYSNLSYSNLSGSNLRGSNLRGSNLSDSNLSDSNLSDSDLSDSNLSYSNLSYSNLSGSDLSYSNLRYSDLSYSNLRYSNLSGSNLRGSNLRGSNLSYSNLRDSNLSYSNLSGSDLSGSILPAFLIVPQQGSFIAWKKASGVVVKLEIPADAKRCNSLVGRKCRAEFVRVLAIDGDTTPGKSVNGSHNHSIIYTVGGITRPDKYDDDIRVECTNGIHFFITYEEAKEY